MFSQSISMVPHIKAVLGLFSSELLKELYEGLDELPELLEPCPGP